jgi:hypothetical protein
MAIKVYPTETNDTHEHADGTGLDVRDGHLFVTVGNGAQPSHRIAVYAPGKWDRAEATK